MYVGVCASVCLKVRLRETERQREINKGTLIKGGTEIDKYENTVKGIQKQIMRDR